jgi:hypothetical protein
MRRKTQIVLAITFMVAGLLLFFSYIYISEMLRQEVTTWRGSPTMPSPISPARV